MIDRPTGWVERLNKRLSRPLAVRLARMSWITPNRVTWASALTGGMLAPWAILSGHDVSAALLVLAGAWLDSLDGDLARVRGCSSREGEILDAVLDRYIDFLVIAAITWRVPQCLVAGLAALLGSQMVPYIRARSEATGKPAVSTFGSRDIRNMILVAGLFTGWLCELLIALALISNASAIHRFVHAARRSG